MLLYPLCSALLSLSPLLYSTLLFFLLVFYSRSPGRQVAGSPGRRVAGLPGCRVPLLLFPQDFLSVSGSVLWKQQESTVNLPDGNGNQLFTIQSLILQSKEIVSEKRESEKKEDPSRQESGEVIRIQRCMMMQLLSTLATLLPPSLGFGTWPGSWLPYQKVVKGVQGTAPFGVPSERWATRRPGRQYLYEWQWFSPTRIILELNQLTMAFSDRDDDRILNQLPMSFYLGKSHRDYPWMLLVLLWCLPQGPSLNARWHKMTAFSYGLALPWLNPEDLNEAEGNMARQPVLTCWKEACLV